MRSSLDPALAVAALLLACAAGIASDEADDAARGTSSEPAVALTVSKNRSRLTIHGSVSSAAHAAILRRTAATYFADFVIDIDVRRNASTPPAWSLVTDATLRALSATSSSSALVNKQRSCCAAS